MSGILDRPAGTCVIIDELGLKEGTLQEKGLKNLDFINTVISTSRLSVECTSGSFVTVESDLNIILLSQGRSLVSVDCVLPYSPQESSTPVEASDSELNLYRAFIAHGNTLDYDVPESFQEFVHNDFAEQRKLQRLDGKPVMTAQDLMDRLELGRLITKSYGMTELTLEYWQIACSLDSERKARLAQLPKKEICYRCSPRHACSLILIRINQ